MDLVVPWKVLLKIIEPHYPLAGRGPGNSPLELMLRVHLMQNWFALSDPAMEEVLYEMKLTPFRGHLTVMKRGVRNAQVKAAVSGGVSPTDY